MIEFITLLTESSDAAASAVGKNPMLPKSDVSGTAESIMTIASVIASSFLTCFFIKNFPPCVFFSCP
ncbi:MAG: hypothetical protein SO436_00010 [Oscillospiraceae bacterium]|nr:hypothetical protein [Oscillospiraceae bacterium]MDD6982826.1 hypothetical protein [Oscillospiraceae bacterium]MDY4622863.1 hypothetical protein [Oscillospiraceae bacterium]